jgi:hypothetical protein
MRVSDGLINTTGCQVKRQIFFGFQKMGVVAVLDGIADELDMVVMVVVPIGQVPLVKWSGLHSNMETWVHPGGHQELLRGYKICYHEGCTVEQLQAVAGYSNAL